MNYMNAYEALRKMQSADYSLSYNKDELSWSIYQDIKMEDLVIYLNRYPRDNYEDIKGILSKEFPQERFVIGSGSEDLIWRINHFILKNRRVGILVPNFYRMYQTINHPCYITIPFQVEGFILDVGIIEEGIQKNSLNAVWIGNPNSITGKGFLACELVELIERYPEVIFIIDEASMDAVVDRKKYSLMLYKHQLENLIILRTFSKFYGIPGARFGYASMKEEFAVMMEEGPVFPVSNVNYFFAKKIFENKEFFQRQREQIRRNKEKLKHLLDGQDEFYISDSLSNTIVMGCHTQHISMWDILSEQGIISFSLKDEQGMQGCNGVRLTVDSGKQYFQNLYQRIENILQNINVTCG